MDLRERILSSYDRGEGTREEIAERYRVSLGMVKKLLQQRRRIGEIGPLYHRCGRKPMILPTHQRKMTSLLRQKPGLTLKELRAAVELDCSLPAIHYALKKLGLTYNKKPSRRASKSGQKSRRRAVRGSGGKPDSIRTD